MKKRLRVGLAIGSGAAYGLSAVGVLKVMEENNIPIDVISGTSIGAVVGALYASGMKASELKKTLFSVEWKELLDFVIPKQGLVSGKKVEQFIRDLIHNKTFEELKIPLYIPAVDLNGSRLIVFNKGDVASAVRASISIPGIFTPVNMGNMTLVDGAVLDPLPIDIIKKYSDIIIAINYKRAEKSTNYVSAEKEESEFLQAVKRDLIKTEFKYLEEFLKKGKLRIPLPFRWFLSPRYIYNLIKKKDIPVSSFKILEVTKQSYHITADKMAELELKINKPDILIKPDLPDMNWLEFDKGPYALKQGESAAKEKISQIKKILRKKST